MEKIEIIDGEQYYVTRDEKGELISMFITSDEYVETPPKPYVPTQLDLIQANVDYLMAVTL